MSARACSVGVEYYNGEQLLQGGEREGRGRRRVDVVVVLKRIMVPSPAPTVLPPPPPPSPPPPRVSKERHPFAEEERGVVMQLGWLGGDLQPLSLSPSPRPPSSAAKEGTLPPQLPACAPFVFSFVRGRGMERPFAYVIVATATYNWRERKLGRPFSI